MSCVIHFSAISIMIGMATYTALQIQELRPLADISWGYSYALGWTAFSLSLVAGSVAVAA